MENPALAKVIDADPDDATAWAVYADWLHAQGDPRGELAGIQLRLATQPKNARLLAAEKELLKRHRGTLIGDFARYLCRAGKPEIVNLARTPDLGPEVRRQDSSAAPIRVAWRAGFFAHAYAGYPGCDWTGDKTTTRDVDFPTLLAELLASPAARFLTSLHLGMPNSPEDGQPLYEATFRMLAKHPAAARLRRLYLGDIVYRDAMISAIALGNLTKLLAAMPNLRALTLRANDFKLGALALPELRELTIISGGLDRKNVAAIFAAELPKLEKLELWFGEETYGANTTIADLRPLLDRTVLRTVTHLGLRNSARADELCAALAGAKIVKQLSALDLSKGTMTGAGVTALATRAASFAHLRKLDLSDNYLVRADEQLASTIMPTTRTKPQRKAETYDGSAYRYPVVGE